MDLQTILISAVSAGGIGAAFKYAYDIKQTVRNLEKENKECCEKNNNFEKRIIVLESDTDTGFPEWEKDIQGRWIYVNGEFSKFYLAPFKKTFADIQNKTNAEIDFFSDNLKKTLDSIDEEIIDKEFAYRENVVFHDRAKPAVVIKKVVTIKGSNIIFFRGIACPQL